MKTREQIENLKTEWEADPCWDIEETVGFEDYKEELAVFSEQTKNKWEQQAQKEAHDAQLKYEEKLRMVMTFDAIHQARLAVVDGELERAKVWSAIAQAEAMQKLASTVVPLTSGEFVVNTFDNSRDNF